MKTRLKTVFYYLPYGFDWSWCISVLEKIGDGARRERQIDR